MSKEMTMVDYFKKFQEQMKSMSSNTKQNEISSQINDNQIPLEDYSGFSIGQGFDNQGKGLINDVLKAPQNIQNINITPNLNKPSEVTLDNVCPQCGTIHPPLKPGQKCPIAQQKEQLKELKLSEEKVTKFVQDLKNIIIANLSKIQGKPPEKILQEITIEVTKFLEKQQNK